MKPEAKVLRDIIKELSRRRAAGEPIRWRKTHGSALQTAGEPDLVICCRGRFVAIEVKAPGKSPTKLQRHELAEIAAAGGRCGSAESVEQAVEILDSIRE